MSNKCLLYWNAFTKKCERGVMVLEDLSRGPEPYKHLDKNRVPSVEQVTFLLGKMAHFHGAWWKVINKDTGTYYSILKSYDN